MPRTAGERYDWECEHVLGRAEQDLPWLEDVVGRADGPVLELACGTGRVTVPLAARTGRPVVGLDLDRSMLEVAARRGARALVQGDMRAFGFRAVFGVIAIPYNSIQLLDSDGRASCLRSCARALRAGGVVAIECTDFQRDIVSSTVPMTRLAAVGAVEQWGAVDHDLGRGSADYRRRFVVDGRTVDEDVTTIWTMTEGALTELFESTGFVVAEMASDGARTRCVATRP